MDSTDFNALLAETRTAAGAPALAAVVVGTHALRQAGVVGVRRLGHPEAAALGDPFHIGSNSKAMTAQVCAALVAAGRLSWHTAPDAVLPGVVGHPAYAGLTLELLLQHGGGVPPFTELEEMEALGEALSGSAPAQRARFARLVLAQPPLFAPGNEFAYSNAGYAVAAAMAEAVSGASWENLVRALVFAPCAITSGGFGWPAGLNPDAPWGHIAEEGGPLTAHDPHDAYQLPAALAPAGDVHLSLPDYGRFLQLNLRALQGEDGFLPAAVVGRLHTPRAAGTPFGAGWGIQTLGEQTVSAHAGSAGTFMALAAVSHDRDLAVGIAANAGHEPVEKALVGLLKTLLAEF